MNMSEIVSFDDELLVVVDEDDNVLDYKSKAECHRAKGFCTGHSPCLSLIVIRN